uniref:Uncharacterized protein n=1 Tax=Arundo donax TaxID=35708 RepID=A0A0A8ZH66_ARUDO
MRNCISLWRFNSVDANSIPDSTFYSYIPNPNADSS